MEAINVTWLALNHSMVSVCNIMSEPAIIQNQFPLTLPPEDLFLSVTDSLKSQWVEKDILFPLISLNR